MTHWSTIGLILAKLEFEKNNQNLTFGDGQRGAIARIFKKLTCNSYS